MTNEEIKALLQELARSADAEGDVRSRTVRITFDRDEKKTAPKRKLRQGKDSDFGETEEESDEEREESRGDEDIQTEELPEDDSDGQTAENEDDGTSRHSSRPGDSFHWEIPDDDEDDDIDDWADDGAYFSVIPKSSAEKAKRPDNYREKKQDPQEEEPEAPEEPAGKVKQPVEDADFESDADDFREEDALDETVSDPVGALFAGLFAGAAARLKRAGKSGAERRKEKKKAAAVSEKDTQEQDSGLSGEDEPGRSDEDNDAPEDLTENAVSSRAQTGPEEPEKVLAEAGENDEINPAGKADSAGKTGKADPVRSIDKTDDAGSTGETDDADGTDETDDAGKNSETDGTGRSEEGDETGKNGEERGNAEKKPRVKSPGILRKLAEIGIGGRELAMIAVGVILLALIIAAAVNLLGSSGGSRKAEADEGLTVTVEKEPKEWCSSGEIVLKIRTASPIQSVSVNGAAQSFTGTNKTRVPVQVSDHSLDIMVVCEDGVRNAHADIDMIDDEAPVLTVRREGDRISLEASDERSGVEGIYIGRQQGFTDVPLYEAYSEPFRPENGVIYSCYASDIAGNTSMPLVTDFTKAEELRFAQDKYSLFPGETARVKIQVFPENAWAEDMTLTNSNGSVVSLDSLGNLKALAEGSSVIEASAPGTGSARCEVIVNEEAEITVSTVGDVTLGDDVNLSPMSSISSSVAANGMTFFFDKVRNILNTDDITFANFEGTLTTRGERENKEYAFRGDPSYVEILQDGSIEAVTLANNHSQDYGEVSLTDTQQYLDEAGIEWCLGDKIAWLEEGGARTALIGIYVLDEQQGKAEQVERTVREARRLGADLVITAFHWGSEKSTYPDETQQMLAHTAINAGADLVVGHHPHVLQGIEIYEGKYIAYSLGNFCFGGNSNPSDSDTMIFQQNFRVTADHQVTDGAIRIIPCSVSSQEGWNNYQPIPVEGSEKERIKNKIIELSEQLGTPAESLIFA